jgi:hypothetical protein
MTAVTFGVDYHLTDQPKYRYIIGAIEGANVRLGIISQALELTLFNLDRYLFLESAKAAWTNCCAHGWRRMRLATQTFSRFCRSAAIQIPETD